MGGGSYSSFSRDIRATTLGYTTKSTHEIFRERNLNDAMNPYGISVRESRDSAEHPESLAIVIALDETGSMGSVPHFLIKEGLPVIMDTIIKNGIADPQVLFLGIGDHTCDTAPLQVGQFESSDELLDKWLTTMYLEGRGGANDRESYLLAWYLAAYHTSIDCFEKRKQKGYLFTIGDERTIEELPEKVLVNLMGSGQYKNFTAAELFEEASKMYNVYHIHIKETRSGSRTMVMDYWKQFISGSLIIADRREDVVKIISEIVSSSKNVSVKDSATNITKTETEMML